MADFQDDERLYFSLAPADRQDSLFAALHRLRRTWWRLAVAIQSEFFRRRH